MMNPSSEKPRRRAKSRLVKEKDLWKRYVLPLRRFCERARRGAEADPEVAQIVKEVEALKSRLVELCNKRELIEAEEADKGEVLWTVYFPRTQTPLKMSIFDQARVVTRTPNRVHEIDSWGDSKGRWSKAHEGDPWQHLDTVLHEKPLDLNFLHQYWADVEEAWRRHQARRDFVIEDDLGARHECRAASKDEAISRFRQVHTHSTIKSIEEVW